MAVEKVVAVKLTEKQHQDLTLICALESTKISHKVKALIEREVAQYQARIDLLLGTEQTVAPVE